MSQTRQFRYEQFLKRASLLPALAFAIIILAACPSNGQSNPTEGLTFRSGQSMYIVAFCTSSYSYVLDEVPREGPQERIILDLDAERKVRKRIEEWRFFKVAEKLSEADFIFLVHLDGSSMEGLAIPYSAYQRDFKQNFDLDALREAAFGRYLIGPLKLPTLSRLADRLVQQFREKVGSK